jgi:hypothetical protein
MMLGAPSCPVMMFLHHTVPFVPAYPCAGQGRSSIIDHTASGVSGDYALAVHVARVLPGAGPGEARLRQRRLRPRGCSSRPSKHRQAATSFYLGLARYRLKQPDAALIAFQSAVQCDPKLVPVPLALAEAYDARRNQTEALAPIRAC